MIYKTRKRYRGEPICADPTADPRENETALHFTAGDRRLWISSYEPTVVAGLLAHPDFQIGHLVLMQTNGRECVVGVVGKLPVGALSIGRARKSSSHELIVSNKARQIASGTRLAEKGPKTSPKREKPRQLRRTLAKRTKPRTAQRPKRARQARHSTRKARVHKRRPAARRLSQRDAQRSHSK